MKITEASIDNRTSIFILIGIIIIAGSLSYVSLPREASPDVQIPMVIVSTPYVGVSPEDVESLITQPLEKELNAITEIKKLTSSSMEGYSIIQCEFESGYDIDDALQKVRDKVDKAEPELPNDVDKPNIIEINFSEFPIMIYNISGPQGLVKLKDIAVDIKDEVEKVDGVLEVNISGGLEREVRVDVDLNKLIHYNVRFDDVIDAISQENRTIPGGSIDVNNSSFLVRVPGEFDRPFIIQDLIVRIKDGSPIYVKDVADVNYSFKDRNTYARLNEVDCVTLDISKRLGANIIDLADNVKVIVKEFEDRLPDNIKFNLTVDQSKDIKRSVKNLENNIFSGLVLVLLVLFTLLGIRNASFVALAIPLSMLISFIILSVLDITLNFVVLFSLILALGMLVDNAIVIVENIYKFLEEGNDLITAAKKGAKEVAWPITTSTLTTLMVFGPMMFWPGIIGDFMKYLPLTLIVTLASSLFVALVINPVIASKYMKLEEKVSKPKQWWKLPYYWVTRVSEAFSEKILPDTIAKYEVFLQKALGVERVASYKVSLRNKIGVAGMIVAFGCLGLAIILAIGGALDGAMLLASIGGGLFLIFSLINPFLFKNVKLKILAGAQLLLILLIGIFGVMGLGVEFFPSTDPERIYIYVDSPTGTNIEMSNKIAKKLEERVRPFRDVDVREFVANVGTSSNPFDGGGQAPNKSTITIQFVDYHDRVKPSSLTVEDIRAVVTDIAGAEIEVKKEENGPQVGKPINIEIIGDNLKTLGNLADEIKKEIEDIPGIVDLKDDFDDGRPEVRIDINREKAALFGLNTSIIANSVRTAINGFEASKYRINEDEYDITVRLKKEQRESVDIIKSMRVNFNNKEGKTVSIPLISVADVVYSKGPGSIKRKSLKRLVTVNSNVDGGYNQNEVLNQVKEKLASFPIPSDYQIAYTGADEYQKETEEFLSEAFLIGFLGIFLILVIQFNSFSQPLMIMTAVAISLTGVFIGLIVYQMPFGVIMTGIGVISLAGVVVNNNIVLIDYINILRKRGLSPREAAIQAGIRRFRPVTLTAMTTILGLIPLTFGFGFDIYTFTIESGGADTAFWRSMGIAVIFGLMFGTILTLVIVPVLYTTIEEAVLTVNNRKEAKKEAAKLALQED